MIEPSRIKDEFKKVEKESHRFRTYLKIHADEDELDEQFLELHNELFKNYDCNKCRNCCREYVMTFEESDINSVAKELKITKDEVINKYIKITGNGYESKDKICCFLNEKDGTCKIENCKPEGCREYPFTNKPERLFSLLSIIESASVCPVVFEMLERLKKIYRFR